MQLFGPKIAVIYQTLIFFQSQNANLYNEGDTKPIKHKELCNIYFESSNHVVGNFMA